MIINLANTLTTTPGIPVTYFSSAGTAGGTQAFVKNPEGFTNQWAVQVGQTGEEVAEIMVISGAPSGTTGPFTALATVSIQPSGTATQYNDQTGVSTYAYYIQYYNSVSGDASGSSSIFTPGGPTIYSLQKLRQRIKDKLFSAGYIRDDSLIADWINEAYELMSNAAIKVNQNYMLGTAAYAFGTSGLGTITDSTYKQPVKVEVTYDGVTYVPSTKAEVREFSETDYFSIDRPRHAWIGETVFEILPHNQAGTAKITFSQRFTPLVNDSDELTQTQGV